MKKVVILCSILAACLCLSQNASAQYAGPISRKGADLVDINGKVLTNAEIVEIVGADIYTKTVTGSRKQVKAGRGLIWGGAIGMAAGFTGIVTGNIIVNKNAYVDDNNKVVYTNQKKAVQGAGIWALGIGTFALGSLALDFGIPFYFIGRSRLNWVADTANQQMTCKFGPTPNGVGFALNF